MSEPIFELVRVAELLAKVRLEFHQSNEQAERACQRAVDAKLRQVQEEYIRQISEEIDKNRSDQKRKLYSGNRRGHRDKLWEEAQRLEREISYQAEK